MGFIFQPKLSKDILRLSIPLIGAMITQTLINIVDTIMVGFLPKEYSIAGQSAIGFSIIIHWAIGGFICAVSVGTQTISARRFGEENYTGAGKVLSNSISIAFFAGGVVSIISAIEVPHIFNLLTKNREVIEVGVPYCRMRLIGILAMVGTISYKGFFDGIGKTYVHFTSAVIMNIFNVILSWVLIFGVWIFPKLYVFGAGVAAMISSYIGLFCMIIWSFLPQYRKKFKYYRIKNLDIQIIRNIIRISIPSGFTTIFMMTGFALFFAIVGLLDSGAALEKAKGFSSDRATFMYSVSNLPISRNTFISILRMHPPAFTAATKIIIDILSISFMTTMGMGVATATLVSQCLGRKDPSMAEKYAWESVKISVSIMIILGGIAVIYPERVLGIFSHDIEVISAATLPMRLMGAFEFLLGIGMVLAQALFGAGNTKFVMYVEIISHFTCLVPLSYLLGIVLEGGITGIWLSAIIYLIIVSSAMLIKFKGGSWKTIVV